MKSTNFPTVVPTYVTVVLPLAVPKPYSYLVPEALIDQVKFGIRVEVQFGRSKHYTAVVVEISNEPPESYAPKPIVAIIDEIPIIRPIQYRFWKWMAEYYCSTIGEVLSAALPAHLKLTSETLIIPSALFGDDFSGLNDKEYMIMEALSIQEEISIELVQQILNQKTVYPTIKRLLDKQLIFLKEDLKERFQPKKVACVRLQEPYRSHPDILDEAFEKLGKSMRQVEVLMGYIQLSKQKKDVTRNALYQLTNSNSTHLKAMEQKGVLEFYDKTISRLGGAEDGSEAGSALTIQQQNAVAAIRDCWREQQTVLLHGVTGSGKTRVYSTFIEEAIARGEQVLYLLPEIALTTQIIERLRLQFGDQICVYHSKLNNNERVEVWREVFNGKPMIVGARSALLLPFKNLKLVVVDEEHDPSFKQHDPSPRYNGRDAALYLAQLSGAKVLLGTATPSLESYHNAKRGKYGLVEMSERYGGLQLPQVTVVDMKLAGQQLKPNGHFTKKLISDLEQALERGEQAILFQNRRGYAPIYRCQVCDWKSSCVRCDVSLTYHKFHHNLKCHYCGFQTKLPKNCPACGSHELTLKGFGTEKIEDELQIYFPDSTIRRMDFDTVKGKNAHAKLIHAFEEKQIDILIGTQMVTKGLDFENVGLVGVLSADQMLNFPDFRAVERAFQLMEQVSGRAGRKHKQGKVVIQAYNTTHPVLQEVIQHNFQEAYAREILERQAFKYPPFIRMIQLTLKHKNPQVLQKASVQFSRIINQKLPGKVQGPAVPYISRIRTYYLINFIIKIVPDKHQLAQTKSSILKARQELNQMEGFSGVRVNIDVDPY